MAGTVPVLVLNNWVPDPSDSRNFLLAGFVNSNVAATLGIPVESVCRHSNGDVTRGNGPRNIDVRLSVEYDDPNVKVDSAGSEIRGDGRQTGERNASGSWFLKAVRVR